MVNTIKRSGEIYENTCADKFQVPVFIKIFKALNRAEAADLSPRKPCGLLYKILLSSRYVLNYTDAPVFRGGEFREGEFREDTSFDGGIIYING